MVLDAEKIAVKKSAEVAGVAVRFFLVPLSSLKEDYSCSVLVFGMQLPEREQEATFVSRIRDAQDASDVVLSRDKGDYDVLIINAQMALIFVDERKKGIYIDYMCPPVSIHPLQMGSYGYSCCSTVTTFLLMLFPHYHCSPVLLLSLPDQLSMLAGIFSFPGVSNECAPSLTAFKMFYTPVKYRSKEALTGVFAQWKPNIVLCDGTAVVTITDPSAGEGDTQLVAHSRFMAVCSCSPVYS